MLSLAKLPQHKDFDVTTHGSSPILVKLRYEVEVPNSTPKFFPIVDKDILQHEHLLFIICLFCLRTKNTTRWLKETK